MSSQLDALISGMVESYKEDPSGEDALTVAAGVFRAYAAHHESFGFTGKAARLRALARIMDQGLEVLLEDMKALGAFRQRMADLWSDPEAGLDSPNRSAVS